MLNASFLASVSDEVVELYANLEAEIKADMCRRIAKLGKNSDATQWQADILAQTGALKTDIDKYIVKYNAQAQKLIKDVFDEAMAKATTQDIAYYKRFSKELDKSQKQILEASLQRFENAHIINKTYFSRSRFSSEETYNSLARMTLTVADTTEKEFLREANKAYMKVSSGAYSYNEAIADAVNDLALNDVKTVIYTGSGRRREYSIESATRMNVLTGINQTASQQTLQNCEDLGTELVEVSAHLGARPEHEAFQGRVYSLNGDTTYIDSEGKERIALDFFRECQLGTATGICGINCRHSYYPYFEGAPLMYSKNELDEMNDKKVKLDGKEVTQYEAEQAQRYTERMIRKYKRAVAGFEYAGIENTPEALPKYNKAKIKLGEWQKRAKEITKETGLKRDYSREYVGTKTGVQPKGINSISSPSSNVNAVSDKNLKPIDYTKLVDDTKSESRTLLESRKVNSLDFFQYIKQPSESEIIKRIGGLDKTDGSCSSVANAFIANLGGYNVTDYRGGLSRDIFSIRNTSLEMAKLKGVEAYIESAKNDFTAVHKLINYMKEGKIYKLGTGSHASIVKIEKGVVKYLELQSKESFNGWKTLNDSVLKDRFGCKKSHRRRYTYYEVKSYLIEASSLAKNKEFIELMKYLNTSVSAQLKGKGGSIK